LFEITDTDFRTGAKLRSESAPVGADSTFVCLDPLGNIVLNNEDYAEIRKPWSEEGARIDFLQPFPYAELCQNPEVPNLLLFYQSDHAELYDAGTGELRSLALPTFPDPNRLYPKESVRPSICSAAISDDGKRVALGFEGEQIPYRDENGDVQTYFAYYGDLHGLVYDARSGEATAELKAPLREVSRREGATEHLLFGPQGDALASVSMYGDLRLWDSATGRLSALAEESLWHSNISEYNRWTVSFHEDGDRLAAVNEAGDLLTLNLRGEREEADLGASGLKLTGAAWGRGEKKDLLLTWGDGQEGSAAYLIDTGKESKTGSVMKLAADRPALRAEFAPSDEPAAVVWRRQSLQIRRSDGAGLDDLVRRLPIGGVFPFFMAWSPDGQYAAVAGLNRLFIFDAASGAPLRELETHARDDSGNNINALHWSADSKRLVVAWPYGVSVLDALSGRELWRPREIPPELLNPNDKKSLDAGDAQESPDGALLAVTKEFGRAVAVYNVATGALLCQFSHPSDWKGMGVDPLKWSPDSGFLITALAYRDAQGDEDPGRDSAIVWDARTGEALAELPGRYADFSPDGKYVAMASDETLTLYGVADFAPAASFPLPADGRIAEFLFSPDGSLIACGDMILRCADGKTTTLIPAGIGDDDEGGGTAPDIVAFSPDGAACLAGGADSESVGAVFDAATGKLLVTLPGTGSGLSSITFNAQGTAVLLKTSDGDIAVVRVPDLEQAYALGQQLVGDREFTPEERRMFFLSP
jgi:WD40 repeat protein